MNRYQGKGTRMKTRTVAILLLLLVTVAAWAQSDKASVLRPPKGHRLAIMVFEDFQCPQCSRVEPLLSGAAKTYKIPLIRHDFPIPGHNWSFDAHVMARSFDATSPELGEEFRHWILQNQRGIIKTNLRQMADKFAAEHKTTLPMIVDPSGALAAKVNADAAIGRNLGINETPTIYVVGDTQRSVPYIQVTDTNQLFQTIDQMKRQVEAEAPAVKAPAKKKTTTASK